MFNIKLLDSHSREHSRLTQNEWDIVCYSAETAIHDYSCVQWYSGVWGELTILF